MKRTVCVLSACLVLSLTSLSPGDAFAQGKEQSVGAAGDTDRMGRPRVGGHLSFQCLHFGAENEALGGDHCI